jgi:hypothetical protein
MMDNVLCYQRSSLCLICYNVTDQGSDLDEQKSTYEYVFMLNNDVIS